MLSKSQVAVVLAAFVVALADWHALSVCILICCALKVAGPLIKRKREHLKPKEGEDGKDPLPSRAPRTLLRHSSFQKMAQNATRFTRYRAFSQDEKLLWVVDNYLFWSKEVTPTTQPNSSTAIRKNVKQIAIHDIVVILCGKKTENFSRRMNGAQKADANLCFSVITYSKCLDLQARSRKERDTWVKGLYSLLAVQKKVNDQFIPARPKWYKQWPASQGEMNAALAAHLRAEPSPRFSAENESRAKRQRTADAHFLSIWEPPPISMANTGLWALTDEDKYRVNLTRELLIQRHSLLQHDWEEYMLVAFLREVVAKSPGVADSQEIARRTANILMKYENFLLSEVRCLSQLVGEDQSYLSPLPSAPNATATASPAATSLPLNKQTYLGILNHPEARELVEGPVKRAQLDVFHGFDRQGRPVVIERTGRTDVNKLLQLPEQQVLDAHILFLLSFRERLNRAFHELKRAVPQFVYILDMQDASLAMRPLIKLLKYCSSWDIEFMPNTVGVIYLINVPQTILWMYSLCAFFLGKDTAQKIQFFGPPSQWIPALRQCISDNQLPNEYGGSCTWCNGKGKECIPPYPS